MHNYSKILTTIHDERYTVGQLAHKAHYTDYTIFRTVSLLDNCRLPHNEPKFHDFSVIWDKRHDARIIAYVEHLYVKNLLAPILFIGESNEKLSVVVSPQFKNASDEVNYKAFVNSISELAANQYDPWTTEVCVFGDTESKHRFVTSFREDADLYLLRIKMIWELGVKDLKEYFIIPDLEANSDLIPVI